MYMASIHLLNQHEHQVRSICTCTQSLPTFIANLRHSNVKRWFRVTRGNHRNVMKVLLILIVYMFYHRICGFCYFCQKSCQLLSYKSDTCTRFFSSIFLPPLEADTDNLQFVRTVCKTTRWNTKLVHTITAIALVQRICISDKVDRSVPLKHIIQKNNTLHI